MKTSEISLEIFDNDTARWEIFASLEERGAKMRVNLDYVLDRLTKWHERDSRIGLSSGTLHQGIAAPSFHLPLEIGIKFAPQGRGWHPILSDLVPQGFARSYVSAFSDPPIRTV